MSDTSQPSSVSPEPAPAPETPVDAGSQALAEALRSSFGIVKILMAVLVLVFLASGVFKVGPDEKAIKLRMGKVVGAGQKALLDPGLHWSFPYPIEEYVKVSVSGFKQVRSTIGWYATTEAQELAGTEPMAGVTLNPSVDGYVLTADNNIVHTRAKLTYHIVDPVGYIFNFTNAQNVVQNALDNALLFSAAHFNVDDILTRDVLGFREAVRKRVTESVEAQNLGIMVDECSVETRPPRQLKDAFDNVLKAELTRNKVLNEARSQANQVLSRAGADGASRINLAQSERVRYVSDVSSQARRFDELLPRFRENPKLFVEKSLAETFGRVFTNAQDKIFVAAGPGGRPRELRPLLNLPLPKPKPEETKSP